MICTNVMSQTMRSTLFYRRWREKNLEKARKYIRGSFRLSRTLPVRNAAATESSFVKPDFHTNLDRDWLAILSGGIEFPGVDGIDCLFVQARPQTLCDLNVSGLSLRGNDQREYSHSLVLGFVVLFFFFGELRTRRYGDSWWFDAIPDFTRGGFFRRRRLRRRVRRRSGLILCNC